MDALDYSVLKQVEQWLAQGKGVCLVTVVRNWGSAPRPLGSLFAATADGDFVGSVSGGCIEDDLMDRFSKDFPDGVSVAKYGIGAEQLRRFGLPCGGTLELVIERIRDASGVATLLKAIKARQLIERRVEIATGKADLVPGCGDFRVRYDGQVFSQLFGPHWRLLIIGAGAVSEILAQMAPALDFAVYINDPREDQRDNWQTPGVQWLDGMPDDAVVAFEPDQRTVILTLSHDPKVDDMALMEALKSDAFYVGAIGSQATTLNRRERLLTLDLNEQDLDRLHAPIGLLINSRTPVEIAIAILADLINRRNRRTNTGEPRPVTSSCAIG